MTTMRRLALTAVLLTLIAAENKCQMLSSDNHRPALVLVVVVDQMRADYLDRFADLYRDGGFRFLLHHGARFTQCNYRHIPTNTAPGHSIILSGIMPATNGIISNEWYSKELSRRYYCVEDSAVHTVGIPGSDPVGAMSPRNFHGMPFPDQLTAASPSSKVLGVAIKDRGAILLAGKHPTGAYWFDPASGQWITSSYYVQKLPLWVDELNSRKLPEMYLNAQWGHLLLPSAYERSSPDSAQGEGVLPGERYPVFPHTINDLALPQFRNVPGASGSRRFDALLPTPFGNDLTISIAEAAIEGEKMGQRGVTDILAVSFSSPDYCGHLFGPSSHEIEDMYLRLDAQLASFFRFVDAKVGLRNVLIVLTADHGVCPLPEEMSSGTASRLDPKDVLVDIKVRIGQQFNYDEGQENILLAYSNDWFYLDLPKITAKGFDIGTFERAVGKAALAEHHIIDYFTRTDVLDATTRSNQTLSAVRNGFDPSRSGDVFAVVEPFSFTASGTTGTTHGSGYAYDTHVPLLLAGAGIRAGEYNQKCSPNDIAPTLATILGVQSLPDCAGSALTPVILTSVAQPRPVEIPDTGASVSQAGTP